VRAGLVNRTDTITTESPLRCMAVNADGSFWEWGANSTIICMNDKAISGSFNDSPVKVMDDVIPVGNAPGMDVPAQLLNDRTMVPLRFISEYFNAVVEWDSETRTITIVK